MRIARFHGDDYDRWPGKAIFLQRDKTEYRGQLVDCVRVSLNPPAAPASTMPAAQQPAPQLTKEQAAYEVAAMAGESEIPF
jgi:hypothetical protein